MNAPKSQWTDQQIDQIIGNLLRAGVALSAILVSVGGVLYLVRHGAEIPDHHVFRGNLILHLPPFPQTPVILEN